MDMTTGNDRVDEMLDAMTDRGADIVGLLTERERVQGDGATVPYPTDPSVSMGGDAADAGATRPAADADAPWHPSADCSCSLCRQDTSSAPVFAPRADLESEKPLGVVLSNAIVVLNVAPIAEPLDEDFDQALDRLDIDEPVMLVRESDILQLRDLLITAQARAERDAECLKTARKNVGLALAEARRLTVGAST